MKEFATEIGIAAPPAAIWAILTDAAAYPMLDPAITRLEGRIGFRERLVVHSNGRAFRLGVTALVPNERMVWVGGMPFGLFKGERTFTLAPAGNGRTTFRMREVFTGLLSPVIVKSLPDLQPRFDTFARHLKERAETAA